MYLTAEGVAIGGEEVGVGIFEDPMDGGIPKLPGPEVAIVPMKIA